MRSRTKIGIIRAIVGDGKSEQEAEVRFTRMLESGEWIPTPTNDDHYEQAPEGSGQRTHISAPQTKGKYGKSGCFYVENPFGKGNYEIARFSSARAYRSFEPPTYISREQMMDDLETVEYYEFTVFVRGEKRIYHTDTCGKILDDVSSMKEMLELLYRINGRDNVKFNYDKCITTSLESLV